MPDHDDHTRELPRDSVQAARERTTEVAGELAETATSLRRAITDGILPPKATEKLAAHLSDLAARMHDPWPARSEMETDDGPGGK